LFRAGVYSKQVGKEKRLGGRPHPYGPYEKASNAPVFKHE